MQTLREIEGIQLGWRVWEGTERACLAKCREMNVSPVGPRQRGPDRDPAGRRVARLAYYDLPPYRGFLREVKRGTWRLALAPARETEGEQCKPN